MAIAVVLTFSGGTLERYDALLAKLGFEAGEPGPPGCLFSWVSATDNGLLVTAVWESKRGFEQFATSFGASAGEVGVRAPPQITFHEVHSYLTAGPPRSTPAAVRRRPLPPGRSPAPPP
jgi:hypothetical protein